MARPGCQCIETGTRIHVLINFQGRGSDAGSRSTQLKVEDTINEQKTQKLT